MRERRWVSRSATLTSLSAGADMDGGDVIIMEPALSESNEEGVSELRALEDTNLDMGSVEIEDMPADPAQMSSGFDDTEEESTDSIPGDNPGALCQEEQDE